MRIRISNCVLVVALWLIQFTMVSNAQVIETLAGDQLKELNSQVGIGESLTIVSKEGQSHEVVYRGIEYELREIITSSGEAGNESLVNYAVSTIHSVEYSRKGRFTTTSVGGGLLIGSIVGYLVGGFSRPHHRTPEGINIGNNNYLYGMAIGAVAGIAAGILIPTASSKTVVIEF